jgi:outer membrane protein
MRGVFFVAFGLVFGMSVYGQRFAIVDSKFILTKIPSYAQAQQQLDQLSAQWSGEVEALRSEIDALRTAYEAEKVIMTEETK